MTTGCHMFSDNELNVCPVPPVRKDILFVENLVHTDTSVFLCYSPFIWGTFTHWTGSRTVPCFKDHKRCPGGHKEITMRWKGYLHCFSHQRRQAVILQVTDDAARKLLQALAPGQSLRGMTIKGRRAGHKKGPCNMWPDQYAALRTDQELAEHIDPKRSIFNMWKFAWVEWSINSDPVDNPDQLPKVA
jgi:hypothetical protein